MKNTASTLYQPATIILARGTQGTYNGFPATILSHYDGDLYEIRLPGGIICADVNDFIAAI